MGLDRFLDKFLWKPQDDAKGMVQSAKGKVAKAKQTFKPTVDCKKYGCNSKGADRSCSRCGTPKWRA